MGSLYSVVPLEANVLLGTISKKTLIIEIVIGVIVILLLIAVLVMNARKKHPKPAKEQATEESVADPVGEGAAGAISGSEVRSGRAEVGPLGQPDPFTGFAAASPVSSRTTTPAAVGSSVAAEGRIPSPPTLDPAPEGTAPGWLPDPSGAADTLRYWDGTAWTQHLARRS